MRIAVATASHETNTFTDGTTTLDDFETAAGEGLLSEFEAGRSLEGIVERLREGDAEVVPTFGAAAIPSGVVERDAFDTIREEITTRLADGEVDGVCLDLHGSMYVERLSDPEGALLSAIREAVGREVPLTAALDMHATITERMVEHLDGVAGYRTAPHTDVEETGERAADLLFRIVEGGEELTTSWQRFPMLLAGEQSETDSEPMRSLIAGLEEYEARAGVYDANYFLGFPWADSPHAGCHALVTGSADERGAVASAASELAEAFWARREEFDFTTPAYDLSGALDAAAAHDGRPAVIADTGDIPGAGASQDTVDVLAAILDRDWPAGKKPVVAVIADRSALEACREANAEETTTVPLGRFAREDRPLEVTGDVRTSRAFEAVTTAVLDLGDADVILADERTNRHRDPDFFRDLDIEPTERSIVVLKSGYLSPAWKETASKRLFALTPGDTDQRLAELPYERVPRPIYPLEEDFDWSPDGKADW